jgi:putative transposase
MPLRHSYSQLYVHLVWATWDRLPLITPDLRPALYGAIQKECSDLRVEVIALGGVADHVHLLVRIPTTVCVAELAKQVKGDSSHLVTHRVPGGAEFKWQGAYGAFSVSQSDVPRIREYILNQEAHHRDGRVDPEWELEAAEHAARD